jgi:hypothetical protein
MPGHADIFVLTTNRHSEGDVGPRNPSWISILCSKLNRVLVVQQRKVTQQVRRDSFRFGFRVQRP